MRMLTVLLAASALTFGATTLYFAGAATRERVRHELAKAAPGVGVHDPEGAGHTGIDRDGEGSMPVNVIVPAPEPASDQRAATRAFFAARVKELSDPASRQRAIETMVRNYREVQFRGADTYLRIPAVEFDGLMQIMAGIMIERQRRIFACDLEPTCDGIAERRIVNSAHPLADRLPPEQVEVLSAYGQSQSELAAVNRWRADLAPALAPSTDDSVGLALKIAAVRQQHEQEAMQRGEQVLRLSGGLVSTAIAGSSGEYETRRASVRAHARRMYDVASLSLTSEQLGSFNTMLDKAIAESEAKLQELEAAEAARNAAGIDPSARPR